MLRRSARVAVVFVVLVAIGFAVLVLTARPRLENAQADVNAAWSELSPALDTRFHAYDKTWQAVRAADPEPDRALYATTEAALNAWGRVSKDPTRGPEAANTVEALSGRLRALIFGSPKLRANPAATGSFAGFDAATAPKDLVTTYNNAVQSYQELREDTTKGIVAAALGYDARDTYQGPA